jgi:hypothetical protein
MAWQTGARVWDCHLSNNRYCQKSRSSYHSVPQENVIDNKPRISLSILPEVLLQQLVRTISNHKSNVTNSATYSATPGRLIDLIQRKANQLERTNFLILDEA